MSTSPSTRSSRRFSGRVVRFVFPCVAGLFVGINGFHAGSPRASASSEKEDHSDMLVLGEVAQPVARSGVDRIAFRSILEVELKQISSSSVPSRSGRVVVSAALAKFGASPLSYSVSATLRDEKSGTLLAIVSGSAQSIAPPTSELRDAVLTMAAHDALSQIPRALTAYAAR